MHAGSAAARPLRPLARLMVVAVAVLVVLVAASSAASAHVTVHPTHLAPGTSDVTLTFDAPNERDDARTVRVEVFFPTATPLLGVLVKPIAGWSSHAMTQAITPVQTDDGTVSEATSSVTWTATGTGIEPGQYQDFEVLVGSLPDVAGPLVFKALQTYSSGEVVRWIEVPDSLNPNPETPAPVLTLARATASRAATSTGAATATAIAALGCALLALVGVGVLLARRAGR